MDSAGGNDRCLLGGFGQHRIACRKRRRDLPGKDRQREVPRADADKDTAGLARFFLFQTFRLIRVIAQEINGFSDFSESIEQGFAGFAGGDCAKLGDIALVEIGDLAQDICPLFRRLRGPVAIPVMGRFQRSTDFLCRSLLHLTNHTGRIGGRDRVARRTLWRGASCKHRRRVPCGVGPFFPLCQKRQDRGRFVDPVAPRIGAFRCKEVPRQADVRIGDLAAQRENLADRVLRDFAGRNGRIDDLVHEGGVRAVFKQPPDEIGQQVAMRPDRRVDPAAGAFGFLHYAVEGFPHAVKPLEFKALLVIARHGHDRSAGMGVMRRELRVDAVALVHQKLGASHVAHIGVDLAGINREAIHAQFLRQLDFRVPIGALDQTDHDLAIQPFRERIKGFDDRRGAAAIGLHYDAEPVPAREFRVIHQRLDHVQ